jgi:hypothetical protein
MHFHSPCCAYNAPNKPFTTHTSCVYKIQKTRTKTAAPTLSQWLWRHAIPRPRPTTNHQRPPRGYSTTTSRHKIARTCTSNARRGAGIDSTPKILGFIENEEPAPRFHNNNRQPLRERIQRGVPSEGGARWVRGGQDRILRGCGSSCRRAG